VTCVANRDAIFTHVQDCMKRVRRFAGSQHGDTYDFVMFELATGTVEVASSTLVDEDF
jgi:hypothetical protein